MITLNETDNTLTASRDELHPDHRSSPNRPQAQILPDRSARRRTCEGCVAHVLPHRKKPITNGQHSRRADVHSTSTPAIRSEESRRPPILQCCITQNHTTTPRADCRHEPDTSHTRATLEGTNSNGGYIVPPVLRGFLFLLTSSACRAKYCHRSDANECAKMSRRSPANPPLHGQARMDHPASKGTFGGA